MEWTVHQPYALRTLANVYSVVCSSERHQSWCSRWTLSDCVAYLLGLEATLTHRLKLSIHELGATWVIVWEWEASTHHHVESTTCRSRRKVKQPTRPAEGASLRIQGILPCSSRDGALPHVVLSLTNPFHCPSVSLNPAKILDPRSECSGERTSKRRIRPRVVLLSVWISTWYEGPLIRLWVAPSLSLQTSWPGEGAALLSEGLQLTQWIVPPQVPLTGDWFLIRVSQDRPNQKPINYPDQKKVDPCNDRNWLWHFWLCNRQFWGKHRKLFP